MADNKENVIVNHISNNRGCKEKHFKTYQDKTESVKGLICLNCKNEWLVKDDDLELHHSSLPSAWCLDLSDTGNYIDWTTVTETSGVLKRGDHVAWLGPLGCWCHAIVDSIQGPGEIMVLQFSPGCRMPTNCLNCTFGSVDLKPQKKSCCNFSMYRVNYPKSIEELNPPELVLMRARAYERNVCLEFLSDGHFATFCKTGEGRSNQLQHPGVSITGGTFRMVLTLLRIIIMTIISEKIEEAHAENGTFEASIKPNDTCLKLFCEKQFIGATLLVAFELLYKILLWIVFCFDVYELHFLNEPMPRCCGAFVKTLFDSFLFLFFSIFSSTCLLDIIRACAERNATSLWSEQKQTVHEIIFAVLGGIVGKVLSTIFVRYIPWKCFRHVGSNIRETSTPAEVVQLSVVPDPQGTQDF